MRDMRILEKLSRDRMEKALVDQKRKVLASEDRYSSRPAVVTGIETEYPAITDTTEPLDIDTRNQLVKEIDAAQEEYAGSVIEVATDPNHVESTADLYEPVKKHENDLEDFFDNISLVRYGTHPFETQETVERTPDQRYRILGDFLDANRGDHVTDAYGRGPPDNGTVDPRNIDVSGMITSTQLNLQAASLDDAVEKANYLYMIDPYLMAISGNARILEGVDTGYADIRTELWTKCADIRTKDEVEAGVEPRVGRIDRYYDDFEEYLDRLAPFFVNEDDATALDQAIGQYWKDVRIKLEEDTAIVENRPISTQPSAEEDLAVHMFAIGRLLYAQMNGEKLLSIDKVNENRERAMHDGMQAKLYTPEGVQRPAREVIENELGKARQGLRLTNISDDGVFSSLYNRISVPAEPAVTTATLYRRYRDTMDMNTALETTFASEVV